jgi:hypothetical protein
MSAVSTNNAEPNIPNVGSFAGDATACSLNTATRQAWDSRLSRGRRSRLFEPRAAVVECGHELGAARLAG